MQVIRPPPGNPQELACTGQECICLAWQIYAASWETDDLSEVGRVLLVGDRYTPAEVCRRLQSATENIKEILI